MPGSSCRDIGFTGQDCLNLKKTLLEQGSRNVGLSKFLRLYKSRDVLSSKLKNTDGLKQTIRQITGIPKE